MKKFLLIAVVTCAAMAAQAPEANAGPLRNLIARITNRPKPVPPAPKDTPVAYVPQTTYVASCASCQGNSGTSGIVWASGGTCDNGSCSR